MRESTRETLLAHAVTLFARSGYNAVSLRDIAKAAGGNVGSLTYHFGSKAGLLREIYETMTEPMNARRLALLAEAVAIADPRARLDAILHAYVEPAFAATPGAADFTRMRAILSAEGNADARDIIARAFDTTSTAFIDAFAGCLPGAPREVLVWRSQFLLGGLYYALINPERVTRLSRGTADGADHRAAIDQLVAATRDSLLALAPGTASTRQDQFA